MSKRRQSRVNGGYRGAVRDGRWISLCQVRRCTGHAYGRLIHGIAYTTATDLVRKGSYVG